MIYPTPHRRWLRKVWHYGMESGVLWQFGGFEVAQEAEVDPDSSVLLLSNHFSWWDGFLCYVLNERRLHRRFHVMMLEEELKKAWPLRSTGAFSIVKGRREALVSLDYCAEVLREPGNLLLIFPQGAIESQLREDIAFGKGAHHVYKKAAQGLAKEGLPPPQALLSACLLDYYAKAKPTIKFYLQTWRPEGEPTHEALREAYLAHYRAARHAHSRISV